MTATVPTLTSLLLTGDGVRHAFFTRQGGVSEGIYAALNVGLGSGDDAERVRENRRRAADAFDLPADALITAHQVHSPDVVVVDKPWAAGQGPKADGMVTDKPGIALGILTADCAPVLFADARAGVIGAAHAGWRGAIGGVLDATLKEMEKLGAKRARIAAAVGPCIGRLSYQVGGEFPAPFLAERDDNARFFMPDPGAPGRWRFDLPGYVTAKLKTLGLGAAEALPHDTCAEEDRFFSYRRTCLRGEGDYGRGLSAIMLA
ncbi:MAG TPA: peptidoglycan editing factor PgeF [Alphaproteobacteria bacterium]